MVRLSLSGTVLSYLVGYYDQKQRIYLAFSRFLTVESLQERNERSSYQESDQWPGMTSRITLYPDPFQGLFCSVVFLKCANFQILKKL